jgi:hypothetical protein
MTNFLRDFPFIIESTEWIVSGSYFRALISFSCARLYFLIMFFEHYIDLRSLAHCIACLITLLTCLFFTLHLRRIVRLCRYQSLHDSTR